MPTPDPTAPTECTLFLTGNDLQVIYGALDELPGKFSRALYQKISGQVQGQIDAAKAVTAARAEAERVEAERAAQAAVAAPAVAAAA